MPYLILQDYYSSIQDTNLQQIISADDSFRVTKQDTALAEIKSYLTQKYDVSDEFRETKAYSFATAFKAKQLIYLTASAYSASSTYALNALTLYSGKVYYCSTAILVPEAFTLNKWTLLGDQYTLYYIDLPYEEYNVYKRYVVGDLVFWKDKVHRCLKPSLNIGHQAALQYSTVNNIPLSNDFPDGVGQTQWSDGVDYSFTGLWPTAVVGDFTAWSNVTAYTTGQRVSQDSIIWQAQANSTDVEPGTDITKWLPIAWTLGDNRNPQLVELLVHITIYKLSTRISPRNIPDIWVKNYDDAISWLKKCAKGEVTLDAPKLQPSQGTRVRYGTRVRNINDY